MPNYLSPGVYIEEISSASRSIEGVETSTALFIGYAERGAVGTPVLLAKWDDYEDEYGPLRNTGKTEVPDRLGYAVRAFFMNGGGKCYVVRLAGGDHDTTPTLRKAFGLIKNPDDATKALRFEAINEGAWAAGTGIKLTAKPAPGFYDVEVETLNSDGTFEVTEKFTDAQLVSGTNQSLDAMLEERSALIRLTHEDLPAADTATSIFDNLTAELRDGGNGSPADQQQYSDLFGKLVKYRDVNIICLPDHAWTPTGIPFVELAVAFAEQVRRCMVIVDPPPTTEFTNEKSFTDQGFPTSTYTALYYPWPQVPNVYFDPEDMPGVPEAFLVPPSAFAAGMWSKIDSRRGVWKSPGGAETRLLGLSGVEYVVEDAEQDAANPQGVNCIRNFPGYGNVIWGVRTLATRAAPEWGYLAVRRTALFIEQSIDQGIQWSVMEGNAAPLWSYLRSSIAGFMDGLYRSGAFQGAKASDAYYVRCGIPDTMTQNDVDRGEVIVVVGFAPIKPAEFVIVRIQHKIGQD